MVVVTVLIVFWWCSMVVVVCWVNDGLMVVTMWFITVLRLIQSQHSSVINHDNSHIYTHYSSWNDGQMMLNFICFRCFIWWPQILVDVGTVGFMLRTQWPTITGFDNGYNSHGDNKQSWMVILIVSDNRSSTVTMMAAAVVIITIRMIHYDQVIVPWFIHDCSNSLFKIMNMVNYVVVIKL